MVNLQTEHQGAQKNNNVGLSDSDARLVCLPLVSSNSKSGALVSPDVDNKLDSWNQVIAINIATNTSAWVVKFFNINTTAALGIIKVHSYVIKVHCI